MLVREVMSSPVITVRSGDAVRTAVRVLYAANVTAAPVVDDGELVGVVSELDLLRGEFDHDPRATLRGVPAAAAPPPRRVLDVMTREVLTVTPTTDAAELTELMVAKRVKSLPVVSGGEVVGIVSRRDLMAMLARPDEDLRRDVERALARQYPSGPHWDVRVQDGVATLTGPHDGIADLLARTVPGVVRVLRVPEGPSSH